MGLVNPSLLLMGVLLIAVPIVLHLAMRQRPRQLVFPAVRFIKQRRESNKRSLQLRQLLLLLLRCGALVLLGAALARPKVEQAEMGDWLIVGGIGVLLVITVLAAALAHVQSRGKSLVLGLTALSIALLLGLIAQTVRTVWQGSGISLGDQQLPVAAVMVFDTSPRMQYRHANSTRQQLAVARAKAILKGLPTGSQLAICDSQSSRATFVDRAAGEVSLAESVRSTTMPRPLVEVVRDIVARLADDEDDERRRFRKEIYVFTDCSAPAWKISEQDAEQIRAQLEKIRDCRLYVIDVGVEKPRNLLLSEPRLAQQAISRNGTAEVEIDLRYAAPDDAPPASADVALLIEQPTGDPPVLVNGKLKTPPTRSVGRQNVKLAPGQSQRLQFQIPAAGLERLGVHHGRIEISGADDGLAIDDVRHFTVQVIEPWKILVVAPPPADPAARPIVPDANLLVQALAPTAFVRTGRAEFQCELAEPGLLARENLELYSAVFLVDPAPLPAEIWGRLSAYVQRGGGLGVFLGENATPASAFNIAEAQKLLPGTLQFQVRAEQPPIYLAPRDFRYTINKPFESFRTSLLWHAMPVFRHWSLELRENIDEVAVIVPFSSGKPALLETRFGEGRILTTTTPVSDPASPPSRAAWNMLPTAQSADGWAFIALVEGIARQLVKADSVTLNYRVGQAAQVKIPREKQPDPFTLFTPDDRLQKVTPEDGSLSLELAGAPGAYRLVAGGSNDLQYGISANLPDEASDLTRLDPKKIGELIGDSHVQFVREGDEIERVVGQGRIGQSFFPYLMLMLVVVLGLEHLLSNRFYRKGD